MYGVIFRRLGIVLAPAASPVPETSSLVAIEALACGTPVIAFPAGALPEIVEHVRTDFLVRSREMAEAIPAAARLSPTECRDTARRRLSAAMIDRYLALYEALARGESHADGVGAISTAR